jgi:YVTN family beta-propeller protein
VVVDGADVWAVYGNSTLARVDARSVRVTGSTLTGASSSDVALADGSVWVANAGDSTVQRFQPSTFEQGPIGDAVRVGRQPIALAAGHDALWVVNRADDTVTRIDPATNAYVDTIPVGDRPVAVAVGPDAVWVANRGDARCRGSTPRRTRRQTASRSGTDRRESRSPTGSSG